MRVWFVLGAPMARRFVEPVMAAVAEAGHEVVVTMVTGPAEPFSDVPSARVHALARDPTDAVAAVRGAEVARTFASYLTLRTRWEPLMRSRWLEYFPAYLGRVVRLVDRLRLSWSLDNGLSRRLAAGLARSFPTPRPLRDGLADVAPDVVVLTPMIYPGTRELDLVADARARAIPTIGLVLSWDNLTSKATFLRQPDLLLVWNEKQRTEAIDWHGFPPARVEALGAPVFDHLFDRVAVPARGETLLSIGLDSDVAYVLYGVSSRLGLDVGGEVDIARRLGGALRDHEATRSKATLVVRPHPRNAAAFDQDLGANVVVTAAPDFPSTDAARRQLHGLLVHADAVIGLNTSLFIEAAIAGTPVVAMSLQGEVSPTQMPSSLTHFDHLRNAGFVHIVPGPSDVAAVVATIRGSGDSHEDQRRSFVESFVRPGGLAQSAATLVAERILSFG